MDPLEQIRELVSRLTTLTPEELADLRAQIISTADSLDNDEATVEQIAQLQELAGFGEQVMAEQTGRDEQAAQAQADREQARERIRALTPPEEAAEEPAVEEPAAEEQPEEPAEETPPAEAVPAEAVAAAGSQVERMAARQRRPQRSPEAADATPQNRATLTATGAMRGLRDPNVPIEDRQQFFEAMAETLSRLPRQGNPRGDVILASARYEYPEDRKLGSDVWENQRKLDATNALTATGGICLPVNVDYAVPTWATADRPLRDGLPGYEATRGGVRYVQPPDIGALASATAVWTEATDASPGASTKPVVSISCGTEELVYVTAISTRLGFGNMQSRFAPEQVAANTDLTIAAAARVAENTLLNAIAAQCISDVTVAKALSATRDIITAIHTAVAAYRQVHRIPPSQTLTAIFPDWIKPLIKIDMAREQAHDNSGSFNVLALTDEQVTSLLEDTTGLNVIYHIDGQPSSVSGGVSQVFAQQTGTGALLAFPTTCVWYLFAEGMFQFLDGGRLDLGVVRDSTLDATNDYETFVEVFENVAYRGFANGALQLVSTLCATGTSTIPISFTTCA